MASEKKKGSPDAEPMLSVLSDLPVRLAEDGEDGHRLKFKFDGIAKTLAEAAWNPRNRTPLTIVIKAPWGRGKTTLMREIQRQFDVARDAGQKADRRVVDTIWLDVWKYPDEEKIQAGLLGKLLERVQTRKPPRATGPPHSRQERAPSQPGCPGSRAVGRTRGDQLRPSAGTTCLSGHV